MMRTRWALALIAMGFLFLVGQALYRAQSEKRFYELSLHQQRESIIKGLTAKWHEFLLASAQQGRLPKTYVLHWDRLGTEFVDPFFPSRQAELDWSEYRKASLENDAPRKTEFLRKALARTDSWDRVLALQEWLEQTKEGESAIVSRWGVTESKFLEGLQLTSYERTLLDPEARHAFARIFQQFDGGRDFTLAKNEWAFDQVFYSVTAKGELEAFVPSAREINERFLPEFLKANDVSTARIGATPWDVQFDVLASFEAPRTWVQNVLTAVALGLLLGGVGVYWLGLEEQKSLLLKRVTFLNQVVHELKTPLAGLKLHVQLMKRAGPSQATLDAIDTSVGRIDRLFDEIVTINRPTQAARLETLQAGWLNEWIRSFETQYPGLVVIEGEFSEAILSEPKRLDLILRNLVGNALKYGERASLRVDDSGARSEVTIVDEGPGISLSDSRKIFDEFFRSTEAQRKAADGLGLGLSLVKKLSFEIEASVQLANPGEPKAKFILSLPKEKA